MITCEHCHKEIDLSVYPESGVPENGRFFGTCPHCGVFNPRKGISDMLTCQNCGYQFSLDDAPGAAGISADGQFTGICPNCTHGHLIGREGPEVQHSEQDVANIVLALEWAGDNICQRVVDLLWERGNFPSVMR